MEVDSAMKIPLVDGLQDVMVRELLLEPSQLIWDHHGVCHCGRRTFLFSQCEKCARVEAIERQDEIMSKPLTEEENVVVDPDEPRVGPVPKNDVFFVAPAWIAHCAATMDASRYGDAASAADPYPLETTTDRLWTPVACNHAPVSVYVTWWKFDEQVTLPRLPAFAPYLTTWVSEENEKGEWVLEGPKL